MRVLTVMNLYPPHAFGGYEDLCAGAVADWRAAGHDVRVLTSDWRRPDVPADAPPPDGEPVARALPMYWDDHRPLGPSRTVAARWERRARRVLAGALDRARPDVVAVWNAAALSFSLFDLARERGIPVVLVILDRWLASGPAADRWRARFLSDGDADVGDHALATVLGLPRTPPDPHLGDPVVACFASQHLRDHAHATGPWVFDDEAIVPHGLDATRYPAPADVEVDRPWRGRLLYVGRLVPEKGVDTAIRGVAAVPGARLEVVGTGPDAHLDRLRGLVAELDVADRVTFVGERGPAGLQAAYRDADAVVFPSRWDEPFGVVPLEAMASGAPVLATGTGGSGEFLVDASTCLRFAADDAVGLAAAIARLADDTDLRARLRRHGLQVAAHLDRRVANAELLAWLQHAAGGLAGPRPAERPVLPLQLG